MKIVPPNLSIRSSTLSRLSICLSVCLSVCPSVCLSAHLSVCLSAHLSVCLPIFLSVCPSFYLSVCLSAGLSAWVAGLRELLGQLGWNLVWAPFTLLFSFLPLPPPPPPFLFPLPSALQLVKSKWGERGGESFSTFPSPHFFFPFSTTVSIAKGGPAFEISPT